MCHTQVTPWTLTRQKAIVSAEAEEKIRIQPTGPVSQCGRVVTATNIEDMFLFPILEADDKGRVLVDHREQVFTRKIHPSEVDLRKYIANLDEYLYYDITSQAEREFDTILLPRFSAATGQSSESALL